MANVLGQEQLDRAIAECWPRAQAYWSQFLLLSEPVDDGDQPSVAKIHLGTRQVSLHHRQILEKGLLDCVEAILAHEIGHHVRYPGTLAVQARLRLLEQAMIPLPNYSLINLFTDLMINESLGHTLQDQLARVYQAFTAEAAWQRDPAFMFYMAIYEELWQKEPGLLMGAGHGDFERFYPGYRADAQMVAQKLWTLGPNLYTQFIYFISMLSRYIQTPEGINLESLDPYSCSHGEPSPEEWADALTPSARERAAIERALREGWIRKEVAGRVIDIHSLERRILGLPGFGSDDEQLIPEVMAAYYRQEAERYLLRPPPQATLGEAVVPTTLEEWEPGDALRDVDWLATLTERGELYGPVQPLKRSRIAEIEGLEVPFWQPRVEIYLDVSGSMPDPRRSRNAMTLAAQILSTGAIRSGGWARALLYSGDTVAYWQWCRSEIELSRFLMHYIGGGTVFPFAKLESSIVECGTTQPIRLIITDRDFDSNYRGSPDHPRIFAEATHRSPQLVLLLHRPDPERAAHYRAQGAAVVPVEEMEDFPRMASALARALFDEDRHGAH